MIFLLKIQWIKKILFPVIILFSVFFSLAQTGTSYLDSEGEDIACEDLPEAFNRYTKDVELNQLSLQKALRQTADFLKTIAESEKFSRNKLLGMINDLETAYSLSQENTMLLSNRGHDISFFLTQCFKTTEK